MGEGIKEGEKEREREVLSSCLTFGAISCSLRYLKPKKKNGWNRQTEIEFFSLLFTLFVGNETHTSLVSRLRLSSPQEGKCAAENERRDSFVRKQKTLFFLGKKNLCFYSPRLVFAPSSVAEGEGEKDVESNDWPASPDSLSSDGGSQNKGN